METSSMGNRSLFKINGERWWWKVSASSIHGCVINHTLKYLNNHGCGLEEVKALLKPELLLEQACSTAHGSKMTGKSGNHTKELKSCVLFCCRVNAIIVLACQEVQFG